MAAEIPTIIQENYYQGQLLQAADFQTEQNFHTATRNFQTRQILSPGVLTGLLVTNTDTAFTVSAGAAIDQNGQQILLTSDKTVKLEAVTPEGNYQLTIAYATSQVPGTQNQLQSDAKLNLIKEDTAPPGEVLLASVTVAANKISLLKNNSTPVKLLPAILPDQTVEHLDASAITTGELSTERIPPLQNLAGQLAANQVPALENLSGTLNAIQVPELQNLAGQLTAKQVPDLQNLAGQLTAAQLPAGISTAKEYITLTTNSAVVPKGANTSLYWTYDESLDTVDLEYFSETGFNRQTMIPAQPDGFQITPMITTTYTLTGRTGSVIKAQRQVTITVVALSELVNMLMTGAMPATDCVTQIKSAFPQATALEAATAMAKAGYSFTDTGTAVTKDYNLKAADMGKIMATAFPKNT